MKAKDYADKFPGFQEKFKKEFPDPDERVIRSAMEICMEMLGEMDDIRKKRKAISNGAYCAIIEEMRVKWKAIVVRLDQPLLKDDFFDMFMEEHIPRIWGIKKRLEDSLSFGKTRRNSNSRVSSGRY
jgi:hypothetical protein